MLLTAKVKLLTDEAQHAALLETIERVNEACDLVSARVWETKTFKRFAIQRLCYYDIRHRFNLPSHLAYAVIRKVAAAYQLNKETQRKFRRRGAIEYDLGALSWRTKEAKVSVLTCSARMHIKFTGGPRQLTMLESQRGESKLAHANGKLYLLTPCDVPEPPIAEVDGFLGVDLGITNIATDSDGNTRSGATIKAVRHRHRHLRRKLQRKGTRAAKRKLKLLAGKESRFARHVNHVISKQIVATAKGTGRGIALEDLKGITRRVTVRKSQRAVLHSWSFYQLYVFIRYKAIIFGVLLALVNPRNTSRECRKCGHIDKRNRPNQSTFRCIACGHTENADFNAACVIAGRATCKLAEGDSARLSELCSSKHLELS